MRTSTIYTIGTALLRAQSSDVLVDVLVAGTWLHGHVTAVDGHGIVLQGEDDVLSVLRMDSITAVQVRQAAAFEAAGEVEAQHRGATVHPMPAAVGDDSWTRYSGPVRHGEHVEHRQDPEPAFGPVPDVTAVPAPRRADRPTLGPITAPSAVPDAGLHTMLRSCRQAPAAADSRAV
jgi:hypothetical protein